MHTIVRAAEASLSVRRSRFLAFAYPVRELPDVQAQIEELERRYRDAHHIVYAYRLRRSGQERAHDAGEPPGSAGLPILRILQGQDLWDVVTAVVRHFGGVKLGVGNLARAYREAARAALENAGRTQLVPMTRAVVTSSPDRAGLVFAELGRRGVQIIGQRVTEQVEVVVLTPCEQLDDMRKALAPWAQLHLQEE